MNQRASCVDSVSSVLRLDHGLHIVATLVEKVLLQFGSRIGIVVDLSEYERFHMLRCSDYLLLPFDIIVIFHRQVLVVTL